MGAADPSARGLHEQDLSPGRLASKLERCRAALMVVAPLAGFVCFGFTAVASAAVLVMLVQGSFQEEGAFAFKLIVKLLLSALLALGCAWVVIKRAPACAVESVSLQEETMNDAPYRGVLLFAFALAAILVIPNLNRYPWPAPDEAHHLIVARNLAEYGAYASGHPDTGFTYFDVYDSVGAPVIGPVAAMVALSGAELPSARIVVAISYLLLLGFSFAVLRRPFGPLAAALGLVMLTMSFGSVYLSRSLYGEVPAMMFLMAGLWLWGRGMKPGAFSGILIGAGALFGLAVLTKAFILIAAFAFAGTWLYDRVTVKQIGWRHVLLPAAGFVAVLGSWSAVEFAFRDLAGPSASTAVYYRHSLLFGLDGLVARYATHLTQVLPLLAAAAAFVYVAALLFRDRYDPPCIVLYLIATLFCFWWLFFTPGRIPRYLWYSSAVAALFAGPLLVGMWRATRSEHEGVGLRWAAAALAVGTLAVGGFRGLPQFGHVYASDRAGPERELSAFVKALPDGTRIATNYWPAERTVNFMAGRAVQVVPELDAATEGFDVMIYSDRSALPTESVLERGVRMGHYVVVSRTTTEEGRTSE